MSVPFSYRLQEWLAERITWVQYPVYPTSARPQVRVEFKYKMPLWQRFIVLLWAVMIILVGLIALGIAGTVSYAVLRAILFS